jgi:hypothetical protein
MAKVIKEGISKPARFWECYIRNWW